MKVLLVSPLGNPIGGISIWTEKLINASKQFNIDYDLVNTSFIGRTKKNINKIYFIEELIRNFKIIFLTISNSYLKKFDVVHINSSGHGVGLFREYLCLVFMNKKSKIIIHYHCDLKKCINSNIKKYFLIASARKTNLMLTLNNESKEFLSLTVECKVEIVNNFVNKSEIYYDKKYNESIKKIVYTGHCTREKGIDNFLKIALANENIDFYIIGTNNKYDFSHYKNVFYLGEKKHEDLLRNLKIYDVFLFLSYAEGFSVSILEAMANGLPIIALDVGANLDMLDCQKELVIKEFDVALVNEIIEKLSSKSLRKKIGDDNVLKTTNLYTEDSFFHKLKEIYK